MTTARTWGLRLIKVIYYLIATNIREVAVTGIDILGCPEQRHLAIARLERPMNRNRI